MNNYSVEIRKRGQNLLIVEGKHEKDELFGLLFRCLNRVYMGSTYMCFFDSGI